MLQEALAAVQRSGVQLLADHGVTYTVEPFRQACANEQVELIFAAVAHPSDFMKTLLIGCMQRIRAVHAAILGGHKSIRRAGTNKIF